MEDLRQRFRGLGRISELERISNRELERIFELEMIFYRDLES